MCPQYDCIISCEPLARTFPLAEVSRTIQTLIKPQSNTINNSLILGESIKVLEEYQLQTR